MGAETTTEIFNRNKIVVMNHDFGTFSCQIHVDFPAFSGRNLPCFLMATQKFLTGKTSKLQKRSNITKIKSHEKKSDFIDTGINFPND
jgi:hypothetical protein